MTTQKKMDHDDMSNADTSLMKHKAAIHMSCQLTTNERKVYNRMLFEARPSMARGVVHEVDIHTLEEAVGTKANNRYHFRQMIEGLITKPVRYNIFDKDKQSSDVWRMLSVLLAEVGFNEDYTKCRYSFPNTIVDLLKNPNLYARIDLAIQANLSFTHSLPLYEFFIDLLGARRMTVDYVFTIESIRELLAIKKGSYSDYKIFNRDVLSKAFRDINENTDIHVEITSLNYIYDTTNRRLKRVASLNLHVKRKRPIENTVFESLIGHEHVADSSLREYLMRVFENKAVIVDEILKQYPDEQYIRHNVNYAEQRHLAGKVESLPAYARASLEKNYAKYSANKVTRLHTSPVKVTPSRAELHEDMARAEEAERFKQAKQEVMALSPEQLDALQVAYEMTDAFLKLDAKFKLRTSKIYQSNLVSFYMKSKLQ